MFEEKESIWKKKGFYVSVCTAMICLLAIGTVYYRMNRPAEEDSLWAAREVTPAPESDIPEDATGDGTKDANDNSGTLADGKVDEDAAAVGKSLDSSVEEKGTDTKDAKQQTDETTETKKESKASKNTSDEKEKSATSDASEKKNKKTSSAKAAETMATQLSFQEEKGLLWPVSGDVIMKYDMSGTTYFKTLAQYRSNPAIVIEAKEGTKVKAAAAGEVLSVKKKDETGMTVTMNIGNQYTLVYGQLKDVKVKAGDTVKEGETFATIATPSQYYSEEGANLYFQVKEKKETVDPLLLLR